MLFYSLCSFHYIVKSKFGDYGTLDALAEQRRVQGGNFDPRVLTDGSLSRNKIWRRLMIEKVIEHIDELNQPHLKLLVMHDFMWALVEEWASSKAHTHRISNQDLNHDVRVMEAEAHDMSQGLIDRALQPGQPTVCEYTRDKPLTFNLLWDIVYNIHKESLRLDSLEDFNATEVDIMCLKESILSMWKSRDARKTSSLGPTFVSSADSRSRGSTLGKTFTPRQPVPSSSVPRGPGGGGDMIAASSLAFKPLAPPPGIPIAPGLSPLPSRIQCLPAFL